MKIHSGGAVFLLSWAMGMIIRVRVINTAIFYRMENMIAKHFITYALRLFVNYWNLKR